MLGFFMGVATVLVGLVTLLKVTESRSTRVVRPSRFFRLSENAPTHDTLSRNIGETLPQKWLFGWLLKFLPLSVRPPTTLAAPVVAPAPVTLSSSGSTPVLLPPTPLATPPSTPPAAPPASTLLFGKAASPSPAAGGRPSTGGNSHHILASPPPIPLGPSPSPRPGAALGSGQFGGPMQIQLAMPSPIPMGEPAQSTTPPAGRLTLPPESPTGASACASLTTTTTTASGSSAGPRHPAAGLQAPAGEVDMGLLQDADEEQQEEEQEFDGDSAASEGAEADGMLAGPGPLLAVPPLAAGGAIWEEAALCDLVERVRLDQYAAFEQIFRARAQASPFPPARLGVGMGLGGHPAPEPAPSFAPHGRSHLPPAAPAPHDGDDAGLLTVRRKEHRHDEDSHTHAQPELPAGPVPVPGADDDHDHEEEEAPSLPLPQVVVADTLASAAPPVPRGLSTTMELPATGGALGSKAGQQQQQEEEEEEEEEDVLVAPAIPSRALGAVPPAAPRPAVAPAPAPKAAPLAPAPPPAVAPAPAQPLPGPLAAPVVPATPPPRPAAAPASSPTSTPPAPAASSPSIFGPQQATPPAPASVFAPRGPPPPSIFGPQQGASRPGSIFGPQGTPPGPRTTAPSPPASSPGSAFAAQLTPPTGMGRSLFAPPAPPSGPSPSAPQQPPPARSLFAPAAAGPLPSAPPAAQPPHPQGTSGRSLFAPAGPAPATAAAPAPSHAAPTAPSHAAPTASPSLFAGPAHTPASAFAGPAHTTASAFAGPAHTTASAFAGRPQGQGQGQGQGLLYARLPAGPSPIGGSGTPLAGPRATAILQTPPQPLLVAGTPTGTPAGRGGVMVTPTPAGKADGPGVMTTPSPSPAPSPPSPGATQQQQEQAQTRKEYLAQALQRREAFRAAADAYPGEEALSKAARGRRAEIVRKLNQMSLARKQIIDKARPACRLPDPVPRCHCPTLPYPAPARACLTPRACSCLSPFLPRACLTPYLIYLMLFGPHGLYDHVPPSILTIACLCARTPRCPQTTDLSRLLADARAEGPEEYRWACFHIARTLADQCLMQFARHPSSAVSVAAVAVALMERHPPLGELLVGCLHDLCPYTVPILPCPPVPHAQEADGEADQAQKNDAEEDDYVFKMQGCMAFYAALVQTPALEGQHPCGLAHGWHWLASLLEAPEGVAIDRALCTSCTTFLEFAGYGLLQRYGPYFLRVAATLGAGGPFHRRVAAIAPPAAARLQGWAERFAESGRLEPPVPFEKFSPGAIDHMPWSPQIRATCLENRTCRYRGFCLKPNGQCESYGKCTLIPDACDTSVSPVCGCDGKTYTNECLAHAAGTSVNTLGPCAPTDTRSEQLRRLADFANQIHP
ncbi:putative nucleoporin GLE1 [Paratrimastix pyriformis]|uniref:mRNA export factor GLE1 n=1 Tax=Paratrimastix pyriformis TaxID=342808 RepID=A0ABQ8UIL2_9EUKA|nr:putative nucleoporin GLE1 [Paratrimastix pyriformis]